jgi:AmmeMemoRadiSam system protein B
MPGVRPPAVAGVFYPADPVALRAAVWRYLDDAEVGRSAAGTGPSPVALVAPHAGYVYSGPVAGSAYASLAAERADVRRVVVVGPVHYVAVRGVVVPSASAFRTPLGEVAVDVDGVRLALDLPTVTSDDRAHAPEHALEVQLPFLQEVLEPGFEIVPLGVGVAAEADVVRILDALWEPPASLLVVSTDLTHYLPYGRAVTRDAHTASVVEALDAEGVGPQDACGYLPLRALLRVAGTRGLTCRTLDLRNSGDTAGSRDRVVGYGAFMVA